TAAALPDLPYDYGALEPAISGEIMRLHHQKHHQAYVTNYNNALDQLEAAVAKGDAPAVVRLEGAIKFNGGGSSTNGPFLHGLVFPGFGLGYCLMEPILPLFHLQDPLVTKGLHMVPLLGIDVREHAYYLQSYASFWCVILITQTLFSEQLPTLLQYKNVRPDYLKNIWNVINWKYASEVYEKESG
ncbi:hypothetical protein GW17_00040177, partial [Ensete ventricosum]